MTLVLEVEVPAFVHRACVGPYTTAVQLRLISNGTGREEVVVERGRA